MNGDQELKLSVELIKKDIESVKILYGTYVKRLEEDNGRVISRLDNVAGLIKSQNNRIGKLENWRWLVVGGVTIIGIAITTLLPIAWEERTKNKEMVLKHTMNPDLHYNIKKDLEFIRRTLVNKK